MNDKQHDEDGVVVAGYVGAGVAEVSVAQAHLSIL
jgi:hypothetical protein